MFFFILNIWKNEVSTATILDFTMKAIVDLKTVCLDTKSCFYYI